MANKPKTKKPTGLSLKRDGNKFTASWKIADKDYGDGQAFQWRTNDGSWISISISKTKTKCSFTVNLANYFPNKSKYLNRVQFRVRGNREAYHTGSGKSRKDYSPTVSDWATCTLAIKAPRVPKITGVTRPSSDTVRFAWKVKTSDADRLWFTSVEWQALLPANSNVKKGKNLTWKSGQAGWQTNTSSDATNGKSFQESSVVETGSHTRWFRIRARGPHGVSAWEYSSFVWADPNAASITKASSTIKNAGYTVTTEWKLSTSLSRPVDKVKVQWVITTPDDGMACPDGASWQDAPNTNLKASQKKAVFPVDDLCGEDEALYVRVVTTHAGNDVPSQPKRAAKGTVKAPGTLTYTTNPTAYTATITCANNSEIPDSFIAVYYHDNILHQQIAYSGEFCIGIIEHGQSSVTVQCPVWEDADEIGFRAEAVAGSYELEEEREITVGGQTEYYEVYKVDAVMTSESTERGTIPVSAKDIRLSATAIPGTINVSWEWSWADATQAEISWADHEDAWYSTDEPSKYTVPTLYNASWNISGLETGKVWYVRVRLAKGDGDELTYGPYSNIAEISLSSAPMIPSLELSEGIITETGETVASWAYSTTDGTPQGAAWLADVTYVNNEPVYTEIAQTQAAQQYTLNAADLEWSAGETHQIAVKVQSASGQVSDEWSTPVPVTIAEPLECVISDTIFEQQSETVDGETRTYNALTRLPLVVTVEGAGEGGTTSVAIVRTRDYPIERPDEESYVAFEGETVALAVQNGEDPVEFYADDLIGRLDDGAEYEVVATVYDGLGQKSEAETMVVWDGDQAIEAEDTTFEVHWEHQAIEPTATVVSDNDALITKLTPVAPTGTATGDVCDIYRLSADKPVLLYEGAAFGTTYVDPYPALGEHGGHRFVFRTSDGDYITQDDKIAWYDTHELENDRVDSEYNIIEFAGGRVELMLDADVSNSWEKDFKETQYLGGSVQGDWNPAVSRSGSIKARAIVQNDADTLDTLRRLAMYPGICHVRTKDGSSYKADVQVSADYQQDSAHKVCEVSLSITRIDPDAPDGMTLAEWEETQGE